MPPHKPELTRSRRPSGERHTYEVAFDRDKQAYARVEDVEYMCCFCGTPTRGVGYRCQERTACPRHLNDVRGADTGPPPLVYHEPEPQAPAAKKRRR